MDYLAIVKGVPSTLEYKQLFTTKLDAEAFSTALSEVSGTIPDVRGPILAWQGIFRLGIAHFSEAVGFTETGNETGNENESKNKTEKAILVTGVEPHLGTPVDTSEDITSLDENRTETVVQNLAEIADEDKSGTSIVSETASSMARDTISQSDSVVDAMASMDVADVNIDNASDRNELVTRIATIIRLWFMQLRTASKTHSKDMLGVVFGMPGSDSVLTERQLFEFLLCIKYFVDQLLDNGDFAYATALKEVILTLHEILHGLFQAVAMEQDNQDSTGFVVVKSLLFAFFKADMSQTFDTLLTVTNKEEDKKNEDSDADGANTDGGNTNGTPRGDQSNVKDKQEEPTDFRLSYSTLMHIYVILVSLANTPLDVVLVDKVQLSLDITALDNGLANVYANLLTMKNFGDAGVVRQFESRIIPLLCGVFNYYYALFPDVLSASLNHTSFFGWVTGHTFSSDLYLGINTVKTVTNISQEEMDIQDPFLSEVDKYEVSNRLVHAGTKTLEPVFRSPTYLSVTLFVYQLVKDESFIEYLTTKNDIIGFLDIWLCVSSYVHHYQYKSPYNQYSARVSLLILLKLTSTKSATVKLLRDYKINEFKWKICHQRAPTIPIGDGNGEKSALMYIVDVLQVTLRFNLSKKVDLDNCKIALTILYQILLEGEEHEFEDLQTYKWFDLYKTLVHFIKFVAKNCNEEGLKYVIEEVFAVFNLLLSPSYDRIIERTGDFWLLGSHVVKSINYNLLYELLQHHQLMKALFDRYIVQKDNFVWVERCFSSLAEKFDLLDTHEQGFGDVTAKLNEMSLLSKDEPTPTVLDLGKFNYAETFKYLDKYVDKYGDYMDFGKQVDIVHIFNLLYNNRWVKKN